MFLRIMVKSCGIAFEHAPYVGREAGICPGRSLADAEQMGDIINLCTIFASHRTIAAARHSNNFLDRRKIIFRMGKGQAIGGIGICLAINVRDAKIITDNFDMIALRRRRGLLLGRQRLPHSRGNCQYGYRRQCPFRPARHTPSPVVFMDRY